MLRKSTRKFKKLARDFGDEQRAAYDQYGAAGANGERVVEPVLVALMVLALVALKTSSPSFFGGGASHNPNAPRQGDDLQYRVNLKFEEAILVWKKKSETIREKLAVLTCHGSGAKPGD